MDDVNIATMRYYKFVVLGNPFSIERNSFVMKGNYMALQMIPTDGTKLMM